MWYQSFPASLRESRVSRAKPATNKLIFTACDGLQAEAAVVGKLNALRLKSLIVLMRYSGMRIFDAVTLTTDRIDGKRLFLYKRLACLCIPFCRIRC